MFWEILLGALLGAILSIATTLFVEYFRLPKLDIIIESPSLEIDYSNSQPPKPAVNAKFLRVKLWNRAPNLFHKWMNKIIPLNDATSCHGTIEFFHKDNGALVFRNPMKLRWAGSTDIFYHHYENERIITTIDFNKVSGSYWRTCYPNRVETIDVAARFDDETNCYGWTTDSMFGNNLWKKPKYQLSPGRYLVKIEVRSVNRIKQEYFQLDNSSGIENFRLLNADKTDIDKIVD